MSFVTSQTTRGLLSAWKLHFSWWIPVGAVLPPIPSTESRRTWVISSVHLWHSTQLHEKWHGSSQTGHSPGCFSRLCHPPKRIIKYSAMVIWKQELVVIWHKQHDWVPHCGVSWHYHMMDPPSSNGKAFSKSLAF